MSTASRFLAYVSLVHTHCATYINVVIVSYLIFLQGREETNYTKRRKRYIKGKNEDEETRQHNRKPLGHILKLSPSDH